MCTHKRALAECAGKAISVMADWAKHLAGIKGVVLDISGVLYDSGGEGGGVPIPGSIDAVKKASPVLRRVQHYMEVSAVGNGSCIERIKASGLKLRFCTNETQATRDKFVGKLQRLGFDIVVDEVTAPAPAACRILKERNLRPHLLVHDDVVPEFASIDKANPNCVVVGDAADNFSYKNLNDAFRVLIGLENPVLISLGRGRYYKETDGLKLDVGVYMKALEYACDIEAEVVGKPAKMFFQSALAEMGVQPHQAGIFLLPPGCGLLISSAASQPATPSEHSWDGTNKQNKAFSSSAGGCECSYCPVLWIGPTVLNFPGFPPY
ncbi:phospholysine phosphohistidine inorganic pyrophosphate phosphatase isoform X3 [Hemicordylus capensis]|uniref:phospholysine phosphohistidine inorganic pyrophosphate phosphatase isoform X3 n=1 Tax=Hemicordylus capensis TaxID=884348 RepID=UPI0023043763|nr:phospholysine phosphohistidine inorganic pyrophosphate phosphatase isoform X3 [Hemicordylus capensis]